MFRGRPFDGDPLLFGGGGGGAFEGDPLLFGGGGGGERDDTAPGGRNLPLLLATALLFDDGGGGGRDGASSPCVSGGGRSGGSGGLWCFIFLGSRPLRTGICDGDRCLASTAPTWVGVASIELPWSTVAFLHASCTLLLRRSPPCASAVLAAFLAAFFTAACFCCWSFGGRERVHSSTGGSLGEFSPDGEAFTMLRMDFILSEEMWLSGSVLILGWKLHSACSHVHVQSCVCIYKVPMLRRLANTHSGLDLPKATAY